MRILPLLFAGVAVASSALACNTDHGSAPPMAPTLSPTDSIGPPQPPADSSASSSDAQSPPTPDALACATDADCVAVEKNGCCHNGTKEAVAATAVDEYRASFTCPNPHPICPMIRLLDTRVPECGNVTHKCEMVKPDDIKCGGFIKNAHDCASGYHCVLSKVPDLPGTCVK